MTDEEMDAVYAEAEAENVERDVAKDNTVAPSPFNDQIDADNADLIAEEAEHERHTWKGALVEMKDSTAAEVHSVHIRLEEINQHLDGAIAKSEGDVKSFLQGLKAHL